MSQSSYFQLAIKQELEKVKEPEDDGMLNVEEITEDLVWAGEQKIKMIFDKVDENDEVIGVVI